MLAMQLTRFSDLSLRLLLHLAAREGTGTPWVTARESATTFNVPYTHMVKVAHRLGRMGLITTVRGKGGGLRLGQPADSIRLGAVLRKTEPGAPIINCWAPECPLRFDCQLKEALDEASESFFQQLDRYTLADVVERTPVLRELVQLTISG